MLKAELADGYREVMGPRSGTALLTFDKMRELFGEPHWEATPEEKADEDTKVTITWYFDTPRGPVEVRDYWWNAKGEVSIASVGKKAGMYVCRMLRQMGVKATTKYTKAWLWQDDIRYKAMGI